MKLLWPAWNCMEIQKLFQYNKDSTVIMMISGQMMYNAVVMRDYQEIVFIYLMDNIIAIQGLSVSDQYVHKVDIDLKNYNWQQLMELMLP